MRELRSLVHSALEASSVVSTNHSTCSFRPSAGTVAVDFLISSQSNLKIVQVVRALVIDAR